MDTVTKDQLLGQKLADLGQAVVCYSGGVDSSFLLKRSLMELGSGVTAAIVNSESFPNADYSEAVRRAESMGARVVQLEVEELAVEALAKNDVDRCYHCKTLSFGQITEQLGHQGQVLDGTNADDLTDYRPGLKAKDEKSVQSPLAEAGLTKNEIRHLAKGLGMDVWDKPSMPCLNSRVPYGQAITIEKLDQIGKAEGMLKAMGLHDLRVRHHGEIARIEVAPEDFAVVLGHRDLLEPQIKALGFKYVTLDLKGFRSGSLNEGMVLGN